jgi:hypothetical protein
MPPLDAIAIPLASEANKKNQQKKRNTHSSVGKKRRMERKTTKRSQLTNCCNIPKGATSPFLNISMTGMEFHCLEDYFNASFGCNCNCDFDI